MQISHHKQCFFLQKTKPTIQSEHRHLRKIDQGILKGEYITVPLTSYLTGFDKSVLQIKTKIVSYHTADSKPVKQEANGTVILPPLVFPG